MPWRTKPQSAEYLHDTATHAIFIDESGCPSYETVRRCMEAGNEVGIGESHFTTTAVIIKRENFIEIRDNIVALKEKHWPDGMYNGRRVCFHSRQIRNRKGPFHDSVIDYNNFIIDLSEFLVNSPFQIISVTIDKVRHCRDYVNPWYAYGFSSDMIMERLAKYVLMFSGSGTILIESRGKKEDTVLLNSIVHTMTHGTSYVRPSQLQRINGVYFNEKWCKISGYKKSHFGLELADLVAHPIHQYARSGNKNAAFCSIEHKLQGYPSYNGKGLKIFP